MEEKSKICYGISKESQKKIDDIYINRLENQETSSRILKSGVLEDAIELLYEKEIRKSKNKSKKRTKK